MFPPLVSNVNASHLADFATDRDCSFGGRHWDTCICQGYEAYDWGMAKYTECSDADPPGADVILGQEPDEEEEAGEVDSNEEEDDHDEDEDDQDDEDDDDDDDDDAADDGYSE
jgi:hypothetical protein